MTRMSGDFSVESLDLPDSLRRELELAANIVGQGGIVAVPTETYYGLAVDPFNEQALSRLFAVKKRSSAKPILTLISRMEQLNQLTAHVPEQYQTLMEHLWPGPLTLVFKARPELPSQLTGNTNTVGIRVTSHPIAMSLAIMTDSPITATSANISGRTPARNAREVEKQFGQALDFIINAESTSGGLCSTLISLANNKLVLLRDGAVPFADVLKLSPK